MLTVQGRGDRNAPNYGYRRNSRRLRWTLTPFRSPGSNSPAGLCGIIVAILSIATAGYASGNGYGETRAGLVYGTLTLR
jgi:hypothetical protein